MTTRIEIAPNHHTHFITGTGAGKPVRFRPYTISEYAVLTDPTNKGKLTPNQADRIEMSPDEPGDIIFDLGNPDLNMELVNLFSRAQIQSME